MRARSDLKPIPPTRENKTELGSAPEGRPADTFNPVLLRRCADLKTRDVIPADTSNITDIYCTASLCEAVESFISSSYECFIYFSKYIKRRLAFQSAKQQDTFYCRLKGFTERMNEWMPARIERYSVNYLLLTHSTAIHYAYYYSSTYSAAFAPFRSAI